MTSPCLRSSSPLAPAHAHCRPCAPRAPPRPAPTRPLPSSRSTIDKLKNDNEQLKEELQLERKHAKVYDSVSAQAQIAKLQDTGDMYTRKIELEKRRIEELDKQMEIMHKKIWEQRQKMGGINASRENNQAFFTPVPKESRTERS